MKSLEKKIAVIGVGNMGWALPGGVPKPVAAALERQELRPMRIPAVETSTGTSASRRWALFERFSHEGSRT